MTCEQARLQMLGEVEGEDLAAHLASCEACRNEVSRIGALWQSLDLLPLEEPSGKVRERFYEMLGAYRQGLASAEPRNTRPWWQPGWQIAAAAGAAGGGAGHWIWSARERATARGSIAAQGGGGQHAAVGGVVIDAAAVGERTVERRELGVSGGAFRSRSPGALVTAVNHDTNVNVRLAAVDALRRFAASPETRRAVVEALPSQTTPLVQVALIDLLVDFKERSAEGVLKTLAANRDANDGVRQQAEWALEKLQ